MSDAFRNPTVEIHGRHFTLGESFTGLRGPVAWVFEVMGGKLVDVDLEREAKQGTVVEGSTLLQALMKVFPVKAISYPKQQDGTYKTIVALTLAQ